MARKWFKRVGVFFAVILFLVTALILFLHTSWGKSIVRNKVEKYLANKLQTSLTIGDIDYRLPNWIRLKNILVMDQRNDTLLSGGDIYARINMLKLVSQDVKIGGLEFEKIVIHLRREASDSTFNFQFVTDAFSTGDNEIDTASQPDPIQLSVHHLLLNDVRFTLDDKKEKQYFSSRVGHLFCSPHQLDLENYSFELNDFVTSGFYVTIVDSSSTKDKPPEEKDHPVPDQKAQQGFPPILFALKKLGLRDVYFSYKKPSDKLDLVLKLDTLQLDKASLDLEKQTATAQTIFLNNSGIIASVWMPSESPKTEPASQVSADDNWKIDIDKITLSNNSITYHNTAIPVTKGFDYNHLEARHINFFSGQNKSDENGFYSDIDSCSFVINDQFTLKKLKTSVAYTNSALLIRDLSFAINQSHLSTTGELVWQLKPGTGAGNEKFRCRIDNSTISFADVLKLDPSLAKTLPIALPSSGKLTISANLTGSLQDLSMKDLRLQTREFQFAGDAAIRSGVGKDGLTYNVSISQLQVQKQVLSNDLLRQLESENIHLPDALSMTGQLKGDLNKVLADLAFNSGFGQLNIKGVVSDISNIGRLKYDFVLDAKNFETGKWIGQDSVLGIVNGKISIRGNGIEPNKVNALGNLQLQSLVINGYNYSNIDLEGNLAALAFTAKGKINDPNLETVIDIDGNISGKYPVINGVIDITKADLGNLRLSNDSIVVSGRISIDADDGGSDVLVATIHADDNTLFLNGKKILLDSVSLSVISGEDGTRLFFNSPFLTSGLITNHSLNRLPEQFEQLLYRVYPNQKPEIITKGKNWMSLNVSVKQHNVLATFIPDLILVQPLTVTGEFDDSKKDSFLVFNANSPALRYKKMQVDQLLISAEGVDSTTRFALSASNILSGNDSLLQPSISGQLDHDLVTFSAQVNDNAGEHYYAAKASVQIAKDSTVIRLLDHLTLNHNKWLVPTDNRVVMRKDGFIVNNVSLASRGQSISLTSTDPQTVSSINIRIDSFDIGNIFALASYNDTAIAGGVLNADITLQQPVKKFPIFTGKVDIKELAVQNIPVGDLQIYSETSPDSLQIKGSITGNNQADFGGSMHSDKGEISANLRLKKIDMKLVQEFLKEYVSRMSGNVTADFHLAGTMKDPQFNGIILFDSTAFAMKDFQALYRLNQQKITLEYPNVIFNRFTLVDTLGNQLSVNGTVKINNPTEYGLNLKAETKNFVALSAPRRPESYIYGSAIIDAKISIGGTSNSPVIEGNGLLHDKSSIHYVLQKNNDYTKKGKDGIRFVDIDTLGLTEGEMHQPSLDSLLRQKSFSGLMYNLNLEISKDAEFSIIIDPSTNDELVLKGEGQLNTGIEEDGSMGLTGIYKLRSGYYKMNNQFLKNKFVLTPGSTITFNGDPYNAETDVSTQYEVLTSSTGLLNTDESETPGVTKRLPFLVILKIKGPISKPELAFDITLKKDAISIDGSLKSAIEDELEKLRNDVSEINKQAFSLLVANRFTVTGAGDASASSFNPNTALMNGMSQFLSEAMNEVADDLIEGVDLQVDLKNYKRADNTETKTDIGVSMSKDLMDNRLTVTIGKNFTLGEDQASYQNNMQQYIPDITSTYKLSKDGRYRVKAYQKNEYDTVVEGYFTETGVAFTIELDYNKFKELTRRGKKQENQ